MILPYWKKLWMMYFGRIDWIDLEESSEELETCVKGIGAVDMFTSAGMGVIDAFTSGKIFSEISVT